MVVNVPGVGGESAGGVDDGGIAIGVIAIGGAGGRGVLVAELVGGIPWLPSGQSPVQQVTALPSSSLSRSRRLLSSQPLSFPSCLLCASFVSSCSIPAAPDHVQVIPAVHRERRIVGGVLATDLGLVAPAPAPVGGLLYIEADVAAGIEGAVDHIQAPVGAAPVAPWDYWGAQQLTAWAQRHFDNPNRTPLTLTMDR